LENSDKRQVTRKKFKNIPCHLLLVVTKKEIDQLIEALDAVLDGV